jgi:hypothetical protein
VGVVSWRDSGGPAREIGTAIERAVIAAEHRDRDGYRAATEDLAALSAEQAGQVLSALTRLLLEDLHPDGLDGDDVQATLERCMADAAGWMPPDLIQPRTVVALLAGALGIHEAGLNYAPIRDRPGDDAGFDAEFDAEPTVPPSSAEYARHAPLVIDDLLVAGGRRLRPYLDAAFSEIARAETMDG